MARHALVIGAGITGLTTAIALAQAGISVTVFERTVELREVGAGLSISPNATRVIRALGLGSAFEACADLPGPGLIRHYKTGEQLLSVARDDALRIDGKGGFYQIHRADFLTLLMNAAAQQAGCEIRLGHTLTGLSQDQQSVAAKFADGFVAEGDVLIGCDGLRSQVREILHGPDTPRLTGQVAWRCLVPFESVPAQFHELATAVFIGPGQILNIYPIRHGRYLNCVGIVRTDAWTDEGWLARSSTEEFAAQFAGWADAALGVIQSAPADGVFKWALFDRNPIERWHEGRVVLSGDAAHPMLPFLGLGAAMGIEDAYVLRRALDSTDDIATALSRFEATRQARCNHALLDSRRQGQLYQKADPESYGRNGAPQELRLKYYPYDPTAAPLAQAA
jgi:salicylate hydroxylase